MSFLNSTMELKYFAFTLKSVSCKKESGIQIYTHMHGHAPSHTCTRVHAHIRPCTHMRLPVQLHHISIP